MKIYSSLLIMCFAVLSISGCKKDDTTTSGELTGTWKLISVESNDGQGTTTAGSQSVDFTFTLAGKDITSSVVITDNPKEYAGAGSYIQVMSISVAGQTTTEEFQVSAFSSSGTWERNGSTLTIMSPTEPDFTAKIIELTDSSLKLEYILETETNTQGAVTTTTATVIYELERQ